MSGSLIPDGFLRETAKGIVIAVRLTPKAAQDRIDGIADDCDGRPYLQARVRAVPENGRANDALVALLARTLGCRKSSISIVAGQGARLKTVCIDEKPAIVMAGLQSIVNS